MPKIFAKERLQSDIIVWQKPFDEKKNKVWKGKDEEYVVGECFDDSTMKQGVKEPL